MSSRCAARKSKKRLTQVICNFIDTRNTYWGETVKMGHEDTDLCNKDGSNAPTIFPLSPNPALKETERLPQIGMYRRYLHTAFGEPRISNIAVTGGFGVGKSSVVRSLEQSLCSKEMTDDSNISATKVIHHRIFKKTKANSCDDRGFLYISLGSFVSTPEDEKEKDSIQEINAIERRLLLQIYARFHRKDLPLSSFRLIPEDLTSHRKTAILCGFIVCSILLLLFHEVLGYLLVGLSTASSAQWLAPLRWFFGLMVSWKPYIHLLLYVFAIVTASFMAGKICFRLAPRLYLSSIALKSDNAEIDLEKEACESYLDLYSMELVYCLEQLVDQIDSTIVFEDFDRLSSDICIQIFTRLREINYLANLRLKAAGKRIRFIYVINDSLLGDIIHPKFFDYILPVIPYLNQKSAEMVLTERLKTINEVVGFEEKSTQYVEGIVSRVAPYLADFRLQNTILNEYGLLSELYKAHNAERLDEHDAAHLFAFAIYKNIWPNDYQGLLLGKSKIFLNAEPQCPTGIENKELFDILTDRKGPILTSRCLYYAGFNEHEVAEMRRTRWERATPEEIIQDIETIQAVDRDNLNLVRTYCHSADNAKVVAAAIQCMIRCNQTDNSWFFNGGSLKSRLHILAEMEDETIKNRFFELTTAEDPQNMYNAARGNISELFKITFAELVELCRGIKQFTGNILLQVDGREIELNEETFQVKQARAKIRIGKNVSQ